MLARVFLLMCFLTGLWAASPSSRWLEPLKEFLANCRGPGLIQCAERRALGFVDESFSQNVVPLITGFDFVRVKNTGEGYNDTEDSEFNRSFRANDINGSFTDKLTNRVIHLLKTHAIKIDLDQFPDDLLDLSTESSNSASRQLDSRGKARRRRRHKMSLMPIMMMGVLLMGTVLIPMSFQFLAVLGGKALILSKLALMLSSIQGLKKVATSGVNYGLYHTPVPLPEPWDQRSTSHYEIPYAGGYIGHFTGRSAVKSG